MKKILITGGTGSIGSAMVNLFSERGHTVYAPSRSDLDLRNNPVLPNSEFDIIINNAGINPLRGILEVDPEVMQVNYLSPLKIVQQCLPYMIAQRYGRIVNIGSVWVELTKKRRSAYSASKSALHALSKSITAECAEYNVLANTVSPGFVATPLTYTNNSPNEIERIVSDIPIGRLATSDEIARLAYFLTVENTYISGQNIIIDGGVSCVR